MDRRRGVPHANVRATVQAAAQDQRCQVVVLAYRRAKDRCFVGATVCTQCSARNIESPRTVVFLKSVIQRRGTFDCALAEA